jgi:hypothetical protein
MHAKDGVILQMSVDVRDNPPGVSVEVSNAETMLAYLPGRFCGAGGFLPAITRRLAKRARAAYSGCSISAELSFR